MGRLNKTVLDTTGIDKRALGYYSTPKFIAEFLTNTMLELNPNGEYVLDPATGKEELLEHFNLSGKEIDSFDIIDFGQHKYSTNFYKQDYIEYFKQQKNSHTLKYDYFISNPPYNCHEVDYIKNNKSFLKNLFPQVGTLNMYSMFLAAMIDMAKEGAVIGVILSDSFLFARLHNSLRQKILNSCTIHNLILCPNDLFRNQSADVRTVILILQKGTKYQQKVKVLNRPTTTEELRIKLQTRIFDYVELDSIVLSSKKTISQFIVGVPNEIIALFSSPRISDKFKCITGISTGNDSKYLSTYKTDGYEVPFYKNPGKQKFFVEPNAYIINSFIEESIKNKKFTVRNKQFVFKEGISCSSMGLSFSACYLPPMSTFGVNANIFLPKEDIYWMLAYLNSSLVTYLVRGVLIRSNMITSGYVSQIPIPNFDMKTKDKLALITTNIIGNKIRDNITDKINEIDSIIFTHLKISSDTVKMIKTFVSTLNVSV